MPAGVAPSPSRFRRRDAGAAEGAGAWEAAGKEEAAPVIAGGANHDDAREDRPGCHPLLLPTHISHDGAGNLRPPPVAVYT